MEKAARIQYLLKCQGKKQKDVAAKLGVDKSTVSQVINGRRRSRRIEKALARILGVPRKVLFPEVAA